MDQAPNTKRRFDLEERTLAFAKNVIRLCQRVRRDDVSRPLIGQLIRASGSIGANYREANDASSKKDVSNRVRIALREAKETKFWLQLLEEAAPDADDEFGKLLNEAEELKRMFSSIASKVS
jgi:four helix bundle protein